MRGRESYLLFQNQYMSQCTNLIDNFKRECKHILDSPFIVKNVNKHKATKIYKLNAFK